MNIRNLTSSESLRVERFTGSDDEWDEAVKGFEGATHCHLAGWRSVMTDVLGHECDYRVARDETGVVRGLVPLVRVRSRLFGDYLLSMPFLNYGGPIGTPAAQRSLVEASIGEADRLGVDLLELRSRAPMPGDLEFTGHKLTVLMDLPRDASALWDSGLRSKLRSQIRRPMKAGMRARFGTDLVEPFYDVFSVTMRDLGTPVLAKRFFSALAERFPREILFTVVEHEGRAVAAGCGFLWQGEFEITWAGARRELSAMAPNMLLYWATMEESIRRGAHTFNFGRCSPGSGTHRFKRQWPSRDVPLEWGHWSPSGVSRTPNPDSPKFRLATAVWSRLPVGVANRLGPLLSRSLP